MERRHVLIIAVLLLLVTLYVVIVVYGLAKSDKSITIDALKEGFASSLQNGLGEFAPGIDGAGLSCNGQRLNSLFVLTKERPDCVIRISADPQEVYRKATLRVVQPGQRPPTIYVRSIKKETPGVDMKCQPNSFPRDKSRLEVSYQPDGEDEPSSDKICWVKPKLTKDEIKKGKSVPDVGIVVMTDQAHKNRGGKLTLRRICSTCTSSQAQITLMWQ